jgi:hypothetical protein
MRQKPWLSAQSAQILFSLLPGFWVQRRAKKSGEVGHRRSSRSNAINARDCLDIP